MSGLLKLLEVESGADSSNDKKTRIPNEAVEITRRCRISLEWDENFAKNVISMGKFQLKEQLGFAAKLSIMHIHRLQVALITIVKYVETIP